MRPLISIIVPVYNAEKTLNRCVDSILAQSFTDFEVILVDDGSTDQSGLICDNYTGIDSRIKVIHQCNSGVSCARNAGIRLASGMYIAFVDSDDLVLPSHLEQFYSAAVTNDCDVVIGGYTKIEGQQIEKHLPAQTGCFSNVLWEDICRDPAMYGYLWNKLFRLDIIKDHELHLREDMYSQEDLDFCLSVFEKTDRFVQMDCDNYQYYYTPGKRIPPTWDFIANQMKMLRIGKTRTELSAQAQTCVHKRILSLLYTGLYEAAGREDYVDVVNRIARVEGLTPLLQTLSVGGEHGFVARNFAAGKYDRIRHYFKIRNGLRDVVRAIRRRKPE